GDALVVFRRVGAGGLLLVADSRFFSTRNVEGHGAVSKGNVRFVYELLRRYAGLSDEVEVAFPDPPDTPRGRERAPRSEEPVSGSPIDDASDANASEPPRVAAGAADARGRAAVVAAWLGVASLAAALPWATDDHGARDLARAAGAAGLGVVLLAF